MSEEWRAIPGHEGLYEVSSIGRVRSLDRTIMRRSRHPGGAMYPARLSGKVLKPRTNNKGYHYVALGARGEYTIHRMMLRAFVGPCPDGMVACHYNDVPADNRLENLRWDTKSANRFDSVRNGGHYQARQTHCKRDHEFTPENTRVNASGSRDCRACDRLRRSGKNRIKRRGIAA